MVAGVNDALLLFCFVFNLNNRKDGGFGVDCLFVCVLNLNYVGKAESGSPSGLGPAVSI